jgi:hypothetical protein
MVKLGPKGEEEVFIEQSRKDPLMAKDIGHLVGMVFMPSASRHLLSRLLRQGIVNHEKEDGVGFDLKGFKKVFHGHPNQFFLVPDIIGQKPGKTGEGSLPGRSDKGLNGRGSMGFLTQLDKPNHVGTKKLKRRA